MSALTPEQVVERLAEAILAHQRIPKFDGTGGQRCVGCDHCDGATDGPNSPRHVRHVADELAPVIAALIAEAVDHARAEERERIAVKFDEADEERRWGGSVMWENAAKMIRRRP